MRNGLVLIATLLIATPLAMCCMGCASAPPAQRAARLVRMHREAEALVTLQNQLAKHPDDIESRRFYVRVLALTGDLARAKAEVDELERRLPNDPAPYIELGHAYELAHRFEDALEAYDRAASIAPASPVGPLEGGKRAARWGEAEEASSRLEEAVRRGARDAGTYHTLGLVRLNLRDFDGAEAAYRAGLAADPKSMENWLGLATSAVARGDAAGALSAYDAIARERPSHAASQLGRAWALARLGRRAEAEKALDRAAELGAPPANIAAQRRALASSQPPQPQP